jgi:hypothetical protein
MGASDPRSTILLVILMIVTLQTNTSSFERLCGSTMSLLGMFGSSESDLLECTWALRLSDFRQDFVAFERKID